MKGNQCCGNCRFWRESPGLGGARGVCRLSPPRIVTATDQGGRFPLTDDTWCGRWQADKPDTFDAAAQAVARAVLAGDLTAARALADRLGELA